MHNKKDLLNEGSAVTEFLASFDHPLKEEVLTLRQIILNADPAITEGIKWNVPSFRTSEYFATFHLRAADSVQVILHLGAKVRDNSTSGLSISDPQGLLTWLSKERASVKFLDMKDVHAKSDAFGNIIRQWIHYV